MREDNQPYVYATAPEANPSAYTAGEGVPVTTDLGSVDVSGASTEGRKGLFGLGGPDGSRTVNEVGMDLKDFDGAQLGTMKTTVSTYKANIDAILNGISALDPSAYASALFGQAQTAKIADYVSKSVEEIKKMTTFITAFEEGLVQVKRNYEAQNNAITTREVEDGASKLGKSGEEFTGVSGFSG